MNKTITKEELKSLPFMDSNLELEERVEDLLGRLTLNEKFSLCTGRWMVYAKPIKRLGIKYFKMANGPHGVGALDTYFLKKCTAFPASICRAATWSMELSEKFGIAIAQEIRDIRRHCILAPGINIVRTPFCGRTFEYQTEDPYLNKKLAVAVVKGVQSQKIAACVKHYACNNQEVNRHTVDAIIGERALQEIYLPAFEATVREADAWSFMSCYNLVNGVYGSEHKNLLRERLMDEWGFRGFVISDWLATRRIKTTEGCVNAGLTLEMPFAFRYKKKRLERALAEGRFTEDTLNDNIKRFLRIRFLVGLFDDESMLPKGSRNTPEHQALARQIAEEGIVLLKNDKNLLPLDIQKIKTLAVIGPNAKKKMNFGGGSSMVRAKYEITPLKGLERKCKGKVKIIKLPAEADVVIIFAGLNHKKHMDRENKDREILDLPSDQIELINKTAQENPNTIVVLINGSPVAMADWLDNVPCVVEAWYGGLEAGNAIANVLFGDVNPSGKLTITFPKKISDSPAHISRRTYPGNDKVYYDEGIFVGYRHFDTKNVDPLFPFGYGLSYTSFIYENLKIDKAQITEKDAFTVAVDITNSGEHTGAEVVQLYIQDVECSVERPLKELKGFEKLKLEPGQKGTVTFKLDKKDLSFFDEKENLWRAEKGKFNILIGSSSRDIRIKGEIEYLG